MILLEINARIPLHDENSCFVLDIEQPLTRGVASEVICTIELEDALHLKEAIKNAYYVASLEANIKVDLPLANYYNE